MIFSIAITGPTASGKTALSLELAERIGAEIISCDSMQIYVGMDVGTAKATAEERARVRHHLVDFLSPQIPYSVESYRADAMLAARDVSERGYIPLFVGGTGLYIDSLSRASLDGVPSGSVEYREKILKGIKCEEDVAALWEKLNAVDPESAEKIHKNNVKRVIRALEIYEVTGVKKSELDRKTKEQASDIFVGMITLDFHNRDLLYSRCDKRVDDMMQEGLVAETRALYEQGLLDGGTTAAQAIGYKELVAFLEGRATLEEATEQIKLATRRYAKRQLTWFRHESGAYPLFVDTEDGVMRELDDIVDEAYLAYEKFLIQFTERKN